jgi:hypothetical protein
MRLAGCMIAVAALIGPSMASAQVAATAPSTTDERRLTPEQIEAVLAEAAAKNKAAEKHAPVEEEASIEDSDLRLAPQLHGEVGVSVGTGGYREIFGTGIYPLGTDGVAAISLDFVDWGNRRYPR